MKIFTIICIILSLIIITSSCQQNENKVLLEEYENTLYTISHDIFKVTYKTQIDECTEIIGLLINIDEDNYANNISYLKGRINNNGVTNSSIYYTIDKKFVSRFPNRLMDDKLWVEVIDLGNQIQSFTNWIYENILASSSYEEIQLLKPQLTELYNTLITFPKSNLDDLDQNYYLDRISRINYLMSEVINNHITP